MKKYIIGLMAVVSLASCSNDEIWTAPTDGQSVINASFEAGAQSRVGFTDATPAVFFWNTGDKISVHTTSTSNPFITHTLTSGAGTGSAQFQGTLIGEGTKTSICALYPANDGHNYADNTLTFHLPDTYTYANADGQFGLVNGGVSNSTNAPMLAKIATEGSMDLNFKHLGGVFCFQIAKIPATATKFVFTANTKITGKFTVNMNEQTPSISTQGVVSAATEEGKTVTINFTAGTEKRVFYIPVPTGTYEGFRWDMKNGSGEVLASFESEAKNTVDRATLLKMPLLTCSTIIGGITSSVQNVSALNTLLQNGATDKILPSSVTVTDATDIGSAIEIPDAYTSSSAGTDTPKVLNLTFNEVPTALSEGEAIKIKGASSSSTIPTESKASIEIAIPKVENADGGNAPSFDITLPSATVTLAAAEETTTYNKVVATTATNTLIVGKGVTVKTLIVKGGNVRVNDGATVSVIERDGGNQATVTIYKEEGANLPNLSSNTAFTVVDAAIADLLNVAKEGGTYTLTKDLTGDFTISATNDVIINLNGHKITNKSGDTFTVNKGSKLTISGSGAVDNVTHQKACIYNNGTVILNGGTYTRSKENGINKENSGGNSYYNILNHGEMTINPNVEVSQGGHFSSLIDNGYYNYNSGTPRSGYVGSTNHHNPSLVINGGMFSGGINTIKNDDGAILTIVKGTFTNMTQATVQNNNIAEIRGGEFNPTGSATHAVETKAYAGSNNKGETTISGGTFKGELYLYNGANINTASFNITGGTFSDPGALAYFGDNANATIKLNADMKLAKSMVVEKGTATIDLNGYTLTAAETATVEIKENTNKVVAIAVKDGAQATVTNGNIGDNTDKLSYGTYAFGKAKVTLNNVSFGEMVTYAYNGAGTLAATGCTFKGWLSGWHNGGTFTDCTFTIGKAYYPATICYGSTTFTNCKFFKNGVDADAYDDKNSTDADGYYRCNYVVAQCDPSKSIGFTSCKFISENNEEAGSVAKDNHPFHACGWGNGTAANYDVTVDATAVTSQCSGANK